MAHELDRLAPKDIATIGEALRLAADGPLFPDWEFQALFGVQREEVRSVAARWPEVDVHDERVICAVLNSLTQIEFYPHGCDELVQKKLGTDGVYLHQLFERAATVIVGRPPPDDLAARLALNF
jgi:hypothetical protein